MLRPTEREERCAAAATGWVGRAECPASSRGEKGSASNRWVAKFVTFRHGAARQQVLCGLTSLPYNLCYSILMRGRPAHVGYGYLEESSRPARSSVR